MSQDFSKGKIYKITNDYNDEVYIGSTCDILVKRFSVHKKDCKNKYKDHLPLYVLMNEIGFERFRIELIEDCFSDDKYQLRQREGYYIRQFGTLNKRIEGRSNKEYRKENKEKIKEYYINNADKIKENSKEYYINNTDKIKEYRINNADKIKEINKEYRINNVDKFKEYRINNVDKIKENNKEYYINNADKIKEYRINNADKIKEYRINNADKFKEKVICECGLCVTKCNLTRHKTSKKHQEYMEKLKT